jgi:ribosomal protein L2
MAGHPRLSIDRIPNGTNVTRVSFKSVDAAQVAKKLGDRGVIMSAPPGASTVGFGVNETWARMSAQDMVKAFEEALA